MLRNHSKNNQPNIFYSKLHNMLDSQDPLIALTESNYREYFNKAFIKYYSDQVNLAKPIRLIA